MGKSWSWRRGALFGAVPILSALSLLQIAHDAEWYPTFGMPTFAAPQDPQAREVANRFTLSALVSEDDRTTFSGGELLKGSFTSSFSLPLMSSAYANADSQETAAWLLKLANQAGVPCGTRVDLVRERIEIRTGRVLDLATVDIGTTC